MCTVPLISVNSSSGYTILASDSIKDYFVVSSNDEFFTEMSSTDLDYCLSLEDTTCPLIQTIRDRLVLSCGAAIYFGLSDAIESACHFELYPNAVPPPYVEYVSRGVHLVSSPDGSFDIQCPSQGRTSQTGFLALVTLPCECSLNTQTSIVPPSLANCVEQTTEIIVSYPVNTPQQLLFELPGFNINEPALELPQPHVPERYADFDIHDLKAYDNALRIDFKSKSIITDKGPIPINAPIPLSPRSDKYMLWILSLYSASLSTLLSIVVCVIALILSMKYKIYAPLLALLAENFQQKVSACAVDYTAPLINIAAAVNHSWVVDALLTILLAFINIFTFAILRKLSSDRRVARPSTCTLFMTIYDAISTVSFPVATFPACLTNCKMSVIPKASRFYVTFNALGRSILHVQFQGPITVTILNEQLHVMPEIHEKVPESIASHIRRRQFRLSDNVDNMVVLLECICDCGCNSRDLAPWIEHDHELTDNVSATGVAASTWESTIQHPQV